MAPKRQTGRTQAQNEVGGADLGRLGKYELKAIADRLLDDPSPEIVERCVHFVIAETRGISHGRVRALMCRRLKHCTLTHEQSERLVDCIGGRLASGNFAEQFRDQLRLALMLDRRAILDIATHCADSPIFQVRELSRWALRHHGADKASMT